MAEWFKAAVLKTARGFTLPRGFESHPFRHYILILLTNLSPRLEPARFAPRWQKKPRPHRHYFVRRLPRRVERRLCLLARVRVAVIAQRRAHYGR